MMLWLGKFMPAWVAKLLLVVAVLGLLTGGLWWFGASRYEAGELARQAQIDKANDDERKRLEVKAAENEQKYTDAVTSRQRVEDTLALANLANAASVAKLNGLLERARRESSTTTTQLGVNGASPDWLQLFGECVSRGDRLAARLSQVGLDAAGWADQINGLHGYIYTVKPDAARPTPR